MQNMPMGQPGDSFPEIVSFPNSFLAISSVRATGCLISRWVMSSIQNVEPGSPGQAASLSFCFYTAHRTLLLWHPFMQSWDASSRISRPSGGGKHMAFECHSSGNVWFSCPSCIHRRRAVAFLLDLNYFHIAVAPDLLLLLCWVTVDSTGSDQTESFSTKDHPPLASGYL